MNVYIGGAKDYSAMRGPCDSGFHIPLYTEWQSVYNIWTSLGGGSSDGTNFGIALKLPFAGNRNAISNIYNQGTQGGYWSSSSGVTTYTGSAGLSFKSSQIKVQNNYRAIGFSIRAFKDISVIPTSSWTKLYGTSIEAGGIFWSAVDGLISLSSDGQIWKTIADKNLGATQVWNSGDTLSEANCGYYYQRGNNYGFAWTGSITTSDTKVNASNYGPGNYYESSTFITTSDTPNDWSSVQNDNLRGGVTGIVSPVELKDAYIGEYVTPLNFTANTAGSTVQLTKNGNPTSVTLETSTDGSNWNTYTIGDTITLSNIGDKVYFRNTSETDTRFSIGTAYYYQFVMTGSIAGSGDITSLLNKNSTTTVSSYCYYRLFYNCTALTTAPELPATTLANYCYAYLFRGCTGLTTVPSLPATTLAGSCYYYMFSGCTSLTTLPKLPAITLIDYCYYTMFASCSKIKLSTTKTGEYQTTYRIPTTGTGSVGDRSLDDMFYNTGGTFKTTPSINTTYYTSNTVV